MAGQATPTRAARRAAVVLAGRGLPTRDIKVAVSAGGCALGARCGGGCVCLKRMTDKRRRTLANRRPLTRDRRQSPSRRTGSRHSPTRPRRTPNRRLVLHSARESRLPTSARACRLCWPSADCTVDLAHAPSGGTCGPTLHAPPVPPPLPRKRRKLLKQAAPSSPWGPDLNARTAGRDLILAQPLPPGSDR